MPTISMFYGIIVRMYFAPKEHNPPHIHVHYNEFEIVVDINTLEVLKGNFPTKQLRILFAWMELHREALNANWQLCQNGESPISINPLI